jgi:lipopolysaccharide assembly outer membrane protein LptD (OstA)
MSWWKLQALRSQVFSAKRMSWYKFQKTKRLFSTSWSHGVPDRPRLNDINIQMLSESLHRQIFQQGRKSVAGAGVPSADSNTDRAPPGFETPEQFKHTGQEGFARVMDQAKFEKVKKHLSDHKLWDKQVQVRKDVDFELPPLKGRHA